MAEYRVRIEIDVDAENPLAAGWEAQRLLRAPEALNWVVDVRERQGSSNQFGKPRRIDLEVEGDPDFRNLPIDDRPPSRSGNTND